MRAADHALVLASITRGDVAGDRRLPLAVAYPRRDDQHQLLCVTGAAAKLGMVLFLKA